MKQTLCTLVQSVSWEDVQAALQVEYADYLSTKPGKGSLICKLQKVFQQLSGLEPANAVCRIVLGYDEDAEQLLVHGKQDEDHETYALEFTRWAEWLGMEIDPETRTRYPAAKIVACCLWDMTFYGYDEETIQDYRKEIQRRRPRPEPSG